MMDSKCTWKITTVTPTQAMLRHTHYLGIAWLVIYSILIA
jgi:hypothetical protein